MMSDRNASELAAVRHSRSSDVLREPGMAGAAHQSAATVLRVTRGLERHVATVRRNERWVFDEFLEISEIL
jgi:hypothetical protein